MLRIPLHLPRGRWRLALWWRCHESPSEDAAVTGDRQRVPALAVGTPGVSVCVSTLSRVTTALQPSSVPSQTSL